MIYGLVLLVVVGGVVLVVSCVVWCCFVGCVCICVCDMFLFLQVGLCGGHAYSILDVREARIKSGGVVRLIRIRNPHGIIYIYMCIYI